MPEERRKLFTVANGIITPNLLIDTDDPVESIRRAKHNLKAMQASLGEAFNNLCANGTSKIYIPNGMYPLD